MTARILVFESDADFASDVRSQFARLGAQVEVVTDGHEGLERAGQARPDLILLSIELPSMNGFLVCKKLKRSASLKDVPLVILSSDANADEIFEQHKKLRTRADEYIRKPVSFEDLLQRVQGLVSLAQNGADATQADLPAGGDDADVQVDDEIEAFAENAFDSLMLEESQATTAGAAAEDSNGAAANGASASDASVVRGASEPEAGAVAGTGTDVLEFDDEVVEFVEDEAETTGKEAPISDVRSGVSVQPQPNDEELGELRARNEALEEQNQRLRRDAADAERLSKELKDLKKRPSKSPAVSSREFLDLREALNAKDKEILDLRDQLSARDKQLLELRDGNLSLERGRTDLEEQLDQLRGMYAESETKANALAADKEAAQKRQEDLRTRLERSEEKARKLDEALQSERDIRAQETEALRVQHASEVERLTETHAEELGRRAAEVAVAAENAKTSQEAALAELQAQQEQALAQREEQHRVALKQASEQQQAEINQLQQTHAEAMAVRVAELETAHEQALKELSEGVELAAAKKVAEAEARREADLKQLASEHASALALHEEQLEETHAEAMQAEQERNSKELALLGRKLAEAEAEITVRTEELQTLKQELEQVHGKAATLEQVGGEQQQRIGTLETEGKRLSDAVERAKVKLSNDAELLERARRAMSIGLGLLDDQRKNEVDLD